MEEIPYYTYTDKSNKTHGFVLKGLQIEMKPEELKETLLDFDVKVQNEKHKGADVRRHHRKV